MKKFGGIVVSIGMSFFLISCEETEEPIGQCEVPSRVDFSVSAESVRLPAVSNFKKYNDKLILSVSSAVLSANKELVVVTNELCRKKKKTQSGILKQINSTSGKVQAVASAFKSHTLKLKASRSLASLRAEIESDECIEGVSESLVLTTQSYPVDPYERDQKHLGAVYAQEGWEVAFGVGNDLAESSVVAVIDSGIETTHEDLRDQLWINVSELNGERGVDDDGNGYVDDIHGYNFAERNGDPSHSGNWRGVDHGTHVAGLAAASGKNNRGGSGIAPQNVKIMALNVFGRSSGATTANIDNAIRYAADNGADVINMSLGGPGRAESTGAAIAYAISLGATVVVAAGNSNLNIDRYFYTPASFGGQYSGMVTVGATEASRVMRCGFSNYGSYGVEIAAPGCDDRGEGGLVSTVKNNRYGEMAGTSMASPIVAGAAALVSIVKKNVLGEKPSPAEVEVILRESATNISSFESHFRNGKHLNVANLVDQSVDKSVPDPPVDPVKPPIPPGDEDSGTCN